MQMADWTCADICDLKGDSVHYCDSFPFRHFTKLKRFCGRIQTVSCFEDNSRVKEILATPGDRRVLVVDGQGSTRRALLGDLIAASASQHNWAGVVINGVVRDSEALSSVTDLGIIALGTNPRKSNRQGVGYVGGPIEFAGLEFKPDQFIYVDGDGIIVSNEKIV